MNDQVPEVLLTTDAPLIFFPVRHHSPACARLLVKLIQAVRPSAILIEGPADFNSQIDELVLPHQMPIAIYSYVWLENDQRRGAFYPFCDYSPEWQAIKAGRQLGLEVRFIDLPWAEMATADARQHRYSDGWWAQSRYVATVCKKLGVERMDDAWDTLFEIDDQLPLEDYLERAHHYCFHLRTMLQDVDVYDLRREAYMAEQVAAARQKYPDGRVLVVTGGFHSVGILERLSDDGRRTVGEPIPDSANKPVVNERGIALTPFSYKRLDSLSGYEAGMPSPGFYDHVWRSEQSHTAEPIHRQLLAQVAQMLRERKQVVSAADLIAVEMMAQSLAQLRGHARVWRRDLIDGIIGALIKEEIAYGLPHPFLAAVYELFRGDTRGKLAEGTSLPPLVLQLQELLRTHDLEPANEVRTVKLDLFQKPDLIKSRILHQIEVLRLPGYSRVGSSDIVRGEQTLREVWRIEWSPEFEAACIEAAIYGPVLDDAARARLHERLTEMENPNAAVAAGILVDAAQIGLPDNATEFRPFYRALYDVIVQDGDFFNVAYALRNLLYLYRFDEVLGTLRHANIGRLLVTAFQRALWLLEGLGAVTGRDEALLGSLRALLETYERCGAMLNISHEDFCDTFSRIGADQGQTPLLRGAVTGVLWSLAAADGDVVTTQLRSFAGPERLGDFLTGLFALGREVIQRRPDLLETIDDFLLGYDEQSFWEALPSLRLAFTTFTPREKHDIANQLFVDEAAALDQLPDLEVTIEQAAEVLAFEDALFAAMKKYGLL